MSHREIILYIDRILILVSITDSFYVMLVFHDALDINYRNYTVSNNKMKLPKYREYHEIIFRACYNEKVCVI